MEDVKVSEEDVTRGREYIMQGLEVTIQRFQDDLLSQVKGLSTKQLRRALESHIIYPDTLDIKGLTDREQKFISGLILLHQNRVQYELQILAEMQLQNDKKGELNE